jgi:oxazoline/thiazoline synthase
MPTTDSPAPMSGGVATPKAREGILVLTDESSSDTPAVRVALGGRLLRVDGSGAAQMPRLLGLLDGSRSVEALSAAFDGVAQEEIASAIAVLRRHALLEPAPDEHATEEDLAVAAQFAPEIRAFHDVGIHGLSVVKAAQAGRALVIGEGTLADSVAAALSRVGIGSVESAAATLGEGTHDWKSALQDAHIAIVAQGTEDPRFLSALNVEALRLSRPWLLVRTSGVKMRLGPLFLPKQTACYSCYERRLAGNATHFADTRAVREAIMLGSVAVAPADNVMPGLAAIAGDMAAFETLKFFGSWVAPLSLQPSLFGRFIDFAMLDLEGTSHRVLKLPRCQTCGTRATGHPTTRAWMEPYDYR